MCWEEVKMMIFYACEARFDFPIVEEIDVEFCERAVLKPSVRRAEEQANRYNNPLLCYPISIGVRILFREDRCHAKHYEIQIWEFSPFGP